MMPLHVELKMSRPFASLAEEAHLNVVRLAEALERGVVEVLRPYGITATQYNVLRILRGAPPAGLPCSEIGGRMITHEPDVTRLLDRLHRLGFIERERATDDRRVVLTRITAEGRTLVDRLDAPIAAYHERSLGGLAEADLRALVRLLESARAALAQQQSEQEPAATP